ncbi:MAG: acetate--CoA ligase family protein [Bacteroidales bacterium]|nr:acetate--CoA ligase family protein [Bacteroidales bacterium]
MINEQLLNPRSIVVVGGSNDTQKPGGAVLRNLIETGYHGDLYVTNLKEDEVQGITSFRDPSGLPEVDLAIIAIAAKFIPETVELLAREKNTRAFIVLSAGFSEESPAGKLLEEKLVAIVNSVDGALVGPNCIGVLTPAYAGVFTKPIPVLDPKGCDFISGSGATACFIMEAGIPIGLTFSRVFSVGNSAQMGVEEILQYMDETFDAEKSARTKLLYMETISKPQLLLRHASSLIRKGCRIAAIKAGASEAGSRAASSHTGALATPDVAVEALFRKAGIVRCHGRDELINIASIFQYPKLTGKNMAIISHAGGPAVMLTDALSAGGMSVPKIEGEAADQLLEKLHPGSSVANPIDFLATGNAEQLGIIIDYVENRFDSIDGMAVIFGTPGLSRVFKEYGVLDEKMRQCKKPIFPILPSVLTAEEEIDEFISKGHPYFPKEVLFGNALSAVFHTPSPAGSDQPLPEVDSVSIREIIEDAKPGYISSAEICGLLDACRIPRAGEAVVATPEEAKKAASLLGFPLVMKVIGPVHKSDVGGVVLNVLNDEILTKEFHRMMKIPATTGILLQPMLSGIELFIGATYEPGYGHLILCGLGGIFIEVLKDTSAGLSPLEKEEALEMIRRLKSYRIIQGVRGQKGVSEEKFAEIMLKLSALLEVAPEIRELDFNPLLGSGDTIVVVDTRIRLHVDPEA